MKGNVNLLVDILEKELAHRLEKLWRIFAWCSSILLTIIGGLVLAARGFQQFTILLKDRILISVVIILIAVYAVYWIKENLMLEKTIRNKIQKLLLEELNDDYLGKFRPDHARLGYAAVIIGLSIVALIATWMDILVP